MKRPRAPSRRSATTAACIALILTTLPGCSTQPTVMPRLPLTAPAPAPMPAYAGRTYQDVIQYALRLQEWGQACVAIDAANRDSKKEP